MTCLLGRITVEDFEAWQSVFFDNDSFRTKHGQQGYQMFQSKNDPNVVVIFEGEDDKDPRAFLRSEEMRERLADAGLKGQPEMTVMELVDQKSTIDSAT